MPRRDKSYLLDIFNAAKLIQEYVKGLSREEFFKDSKTQSAVIRQYEIIGEAAKRVSSEIKDKYGNIPWRRMAGMRDILIHAYDHVDLNELWNGIENSIPPLIKEVEILLTSSNLE